MLFQREAGRLLIALAIAFTALLVGAAYWAVNGSGTILLRSDNPRIFAAEAAVQRGAIFDRNGALIAHSLPTSQRVGAAMRRIYPDMAFFGTVGYFSQRYGVNGVEAAYDSLLHGRARAADDARDLMNTLLRRPRTGDDVMTTLDSSVQAALADGFEGYRGGAVVLDARSGEVLGLISRPTYDPNTLDADWETLVSAPDNPFFNRAVQGRYQPGGALESVLMASALLTGLDLDTTFERGAEPLILNGLTMTCAIPSVPDTAMSSITLRQAYFQSCPRAFAALGDLLPDGVLNTTIRSFQIAVIPDFPGYPPNPTPTPMPDEPTPEAETPANEAFFVGQGTLLVSPLSMARIAAGIANDGDAPQPRLLRAIRPSGTSAWMADSTFIPTTPMTTQSAARGVQRLMREAVESGVVAGARVPGIDVGGHVSFAYTGDETLTWFLAFAGDGAGRRVALALVLEGAADPAHATQIGARALAAALSSSP